MFRITIIKSMEIILSQRFQFATITCFKDHCKLSDKERIIQENSQHLFGLKRNLFDVEPFTHKKSTKNYRFFDFSEINKEKNEVPILGDLIKSEFHTTKDRHIKNHFGRPFSQISVITYERTILKRGDKLTIKLYKGGKFRRINGRYFRKNYSVSSITINIKTGNFTVLSINKTGKTTSKTFRTNTFTGVNANFFNSILIEQYKFLYNKNIPSTLDISNQFKKQMDQDVFVKEFYNVLGYINEFKIQKNYSSGLKDLILRYFIDKKQIKVPNGDWKFWLINFYPTEKYLKKNNRKLIASVLDSLNLKSKMTIKILHDIPNIDIYGLYFVCKLFGDNYTKYVGNISRTVLENSTRKLNDINLNKNNLISNRYGNYELNDDEKENLFKVINSTKHSDTTFINSDRISLLYDHFNMRDKIRRFDPDCCMRAKSAQEFNEEHREFSKIISAIRKGWVIEYVYDERLLTELEQPIKSHYFVDENETEAAMEMIYPKILTREEDYSEEGSFMHHCVASYSDKDMSMIISLRNETEQDRVTCEFDIQTGNCVQTRHFCNGIPPKMFEEAILVIKERVKRNAKWGTLNWKEKNKVPILINGKEVDPKMIGPQGNVLFDELQF